MHGDTELFDRPVRFGLRPPRPAAKALELRALAETCAVIPSAPWLLAQPRGDGRRVMLIPGFLTGDRSTWPLRRYLRLLGYQAVPWQLGRNRGRPEHDAGRLLERLETRDCNEPISLIGWSLGGVIARLVARERPDLVREIITLGTPVEGGPKYTAAGPVYERHGMDLDSFEREVHEINSEGLSTPLTVIYSRSDAVVDWRAAIDRYNSHARHIRVPGSHLGLGTNPFVWTSVARALYASRER